MLDGEMDPLAELDPFSMEVRKHQIHPAASAKIIEQVPPL